jgi:hypothetical protein
MPAVDDGRERRWTTVAKSPDRAHEREPTVDRPRRDGVEPNKPASARALSGIKMNHSTSRRPVLLSVASIAIVLGAVLVLASNGVVGRAGSPTDPRPGTPAPSDPVVTPSGLPTPSVPPTADPTDAPGGEPGDGPSRRVVRVPLDTATGHDVVAVVTDETGLLAGGASGRAGDGMSVRWLDVTVENLDTRTLRITWVGLPGDAEIDVLIEPDADRINLYIIQPAPPVDSDAVGFDRVLELTFADPVRAEDIQAVVLEGLDTSD